MVSPSLAAKIAHDGDEIQIGDARYSGDIAVWPQSGLRLAGIGGKASVLADGASTDGRAIWLLRGDKVKVLNFLHSEVAAALG